MDGSIHQYAWYRGQDEYGSPTVTQVNNISCLGYEDIYGHKYEMMDGVDLPNDSGNQGKWRIWMPDGTVRWVKGKTISDQWITGVAHGKYMDIVPVGTANGSSSTYYCDKYWISTAAFRVVYRGYSYANANGACRMRMRVTMHRTRTRLSAPVWPSAANSFGRKAWKRIKAIREVL